MTIECDDQHRYTLDGEKVPGVTTILGIVDKSGPLMWWAQKTGVEAVCALAQNGEELDWTDPEGIVSLLSAKKLSVNHVRDTAATRGTSVHKALEIFADTGNIPDLGEFPEEDRGYVQALARAMLRLDPKFVATEVMVGSKTYGYAGRYDFKAWVDGRLVIGDLKTSKGIYDTHHLQTAGYRLADEEMGGESYGGLVICVHTDGSFEIEESLATPDQFLAVKAAYDAMRGLKAAQRAARAEAKKALKAAA